MRYIKNIFVYTVSITLILSFFPYNTVHADSSARDYVDKFQSMDFQQMMNENFSNNLNGFSEQFGNKKSNMSDKYQQHNININNKIEQALSDYSGEKTDLSNEVDSDSSSLLEKFKSERNSLDGDIKSNMKDSKEEYENDNNFLDMFKKEKEENEIEIGGNTPSGLTGFGSSYGGSGGSGGYSGGFGGLPSLRVGPEKRGEISSTVKSMSSKYEDWSAPPAGLDISSSIQSIQENTELAMAGFKPYKTSKLRDYTDEVKDEEPIDIEENEKAKERIMNVCSRGCGP